MSFELTIASKREPASESVSGATQPAAPSYVAIALSGTFDEEASHAVLSTVDELDAPTSESVIVNMTNVVANDPVCIETFALGLMSLRSEGRQVQVAAPDAALHEMMAKAPSARDWLMSREVAEPSGPRRALHLDGTEGSA